LSYAVPIQKIAVDLYFASQSGREPRRGELFVADPRRSSRALIDLLEGEVAFLPFLDNGERGITLVNRDDLLRVTPLLIPLEREGSAAAAMIDRRQHARLELRDGTSLDGELWFSPPAGRSRLSDHLNEPSRFLQFHCSDRLHFVQKAHVARVLEIAAPVRAHLVP
jgi:hypothetical protein